VLETQPSPELSEVQPLLMINQANKYKVWVIKPPLCVEEKSILPASYEMKALCFSNTA
jgi:hypothetical protein